MRIIKISHRLFIERGYRQVTMQDIASMLGMSKKTVYLYFSSKDDIAKAVIDSTLLNISQHIHDTKKVEGDPLSALQSTLLQIKEETLQLSPLFLEDIQKSVPKLWDYIVQVRSEKAKFVGDLISESQKQGLIHSSLNPHITMVLFVETVQTLIRPEVWTKHGIAMEELWDTFFKIFFYGITLRGKNNENR